ncbi:MAG: hypothetical protein ACR2RL_01225, partial [Gammaproteobacteria bacterium]
MGLATVAQVQHGLLDAGRSPSTPAAVVENGTLPSQRVWTTSLDELTHTVEREQICSPALIVIGEVVRLADRLAWRDVHNLAESADDEGVWPVPITATA